MKAVLTITGSDSCGGAGIQADIKTISQLGGYALTAITSITVQNTLGIQNYYDLPPETVRGQVEAVINDVEPNVVKVGLIRTAPAAPMYCSDYRQGTVHQQVARFDTYDRYRRQSPARLRQRLFLSSGLFCQSGALVGGSRE